MDVIEIIGMATQLLFFVYHSFNFILTTDKTSNKTLYHGIAAIFWCLLLEL